MIVGGSSILLLLCSALFVLALRYELRMPLSATLLLALPTVGLGVGIAYFLSVLLSVPVWYGIGTLSAACVAVIAWTEVTTPAHTSSL